MERTNSVVSNSGPDWHQQIRTLLQVPTFTSLSLQVTGLIISFQYLQTLEIHLCEVLAVRLMRYWIYYELRLKIMQDLKKMLTKTTTTTT